MIPGRIQIRRYETQIRTLLNHLEADASEPSELSRWLDRDLHVVVKQPIDSLDPLEPSHLAAYAETRGRAAGMGLRTYPAFRTQPLSCEYQPPFHFASYLTTEFWETNAVRLTNLAALRLPGDPWIGLDMENYAAVNKDYCNEVKPDGSVRCPNALSSDGLEPTAAALAKPEHGFTVAQLRAAMQPFIDALRATNASLVVYPAGEVSGEDLLYVAETLGRERMELWTESTFGNSEHYRRSSKRSWPTAAAAFLKLMGQLQTRFPGCIIRPGISDLERLWADPYRLDALRSGPVAPWGFDYTRRDSEHFGKPEYRAGTAPVPPTSQAPSSLVFSKLNGVRHVWPMQPMGGIVPAEFDTTLTATPTGLVGVAGTASQLVVMGTKDRHPDGIPFVTVPQPKPPEPPAPPPPPHTWVGLRGLHVLPKLSSAPFTLDGTLRLPVGSIASCPLFGAVWYNKGIWQVAYDAARDVIVLCVSRPAPPPGQPRSRVHDMMSAPPRGKDIRLQVGRKGNEWLYHAGRITLPDDAGVFDSLLIGAGQAVSRPAQEFWRPTNNSLAYCPGIVLVKTWSIYDWLLSDDELAVLRAGSWPYGYGT